MAEHPRNIQDNVGRTLSLHEGMSTRAVPYLIGEQQCVEVTNLIVNEVGKRFRRAGSKPFGGPLFSGIADDPNGIGGYNTADFDEFFIGVWGPRIYNSSGNGGWAQVGSSVSVAPDKLHDFTKVRFNADLSVAITSVEQATEPSHTIIYNISTDVATGVSLGARCMTSFQNRLWVAKDETLYWSEIVAPADFSPSANSINIEPGVGGDIVALAGARDLSPKMWILKEDAVILFEPRWGANGSFLPTAGDGLDSINSQVRILSEGAGCVATRSAVWVPGAEAADLFFLSRDGVRSLRRAENDAQAGAGFPLSYNIPDIIRRINYNAAHKAAAAVFDNAYHLALPLDGSETNTHVLRADVRDDGTIAWSLLDWAPRDIRALTLGEEERFFFQHLQRTGDTTATGAITASGVTGPYQIYQGFSGNVDPSEAKIAWNEDSRAFALGDPDLPKAWEEIILHVASTDTAIMSAAYRVDFGPWTDLETFTLEAGADSIILGETPLPWNYGPDVVRKKVIPLKDVPSGRWFQTRFFGATGQTDIGQVSLYTTQVRASIKNPKYEDEG